MMIRFIGFAALLTLVLGCGASKPEVNETVVTGKVVLDGVTLTMGEVYFESADGKFSGRGEIQSTGTYRIASAPLGKVKAAVRTSNFAQFAKSQTKGGKAVTMGGREGTFVATPKKYEETATSGLNYEVTENKVIDIELTAK
ncbi:MAG: hypothetical protein ACRC8S_06090 [Fimbriiglobus sp.]